MSSYNVAALERALSVGRLSTYAQQVPAGAAPYAPLALYAWHAQVSAAFLAPLHICEVVLRNAIADAIEQVYPPDWPWRQGFRITLPPKRRVELENAAAEYTTTGKVIPAMTLNFWQTLLRADRDRDLWRRHFRSTFPGLNHSLRMQDLRLALHNDVQVIRDLRNRIAHHEHLFRRNLAADLGRIERITAARCPDTARWMMAHQNVAALITERP